MNIFILAINSAEYRKGEEIFLSVMGASVIDSDN